MKTMIRFIVTIHVLTFLTLFPVMGQVTLPQITLPSVVPMVGGTTLLPTDSDRSPTSHQVDLLANLAKEQEMIAKELSFRTMKAQENLGKIHTVLQKGKDFPL